MIRVLHVYKDYYPVLGGIENHLRLLCSRLAQEPGLSVRVLVTSPDATTRVEHSDGFPVIKAARLATAASTPLSARLFWELARQEADVTHLHFPYPVGELAYLLLGRSPKLVITYHSDVIRQRRLLGLYRPFLGRLLQRANAIIATSPHYIDSSPYLSQVRHKCTVVPFGVDTSRFGRVDQGQVEAIRAQYRPPLFLFVGRFRYYKGLHYLLEALGEIEGTLLLVGAGPQEPELRRQAQRLHLADRVVFLGELPEPELAAHYQASDLYVLPSCERSEAFGISQLEAMASGLPVVCTELGTGTTFVNRHGETGLVVPPRDPGALAQALRQLCQDGELRARLGQRAQERVRQEFTVEHMVAGTVAIYRAVLQS